MVVAASAGVQVEERMEAEEARAEAEEERARQREEEEAIAAKALEERVARGPRRQRSSLWNAAYEMEAEEAASDPARAEEERRARSWTYQASIPTPMTK